MSAVAFKGLRLLAWLAVCVAGLTAQTSITDGTTPPPIAPGAPPSSYPLSSFETYSPFTGKLNIAVPVRHIGGRGSAGFDMRVRIVDQWGVVKKPTSDTTGSEPFVSVPQLSFWQPWDAGYGPGTVFGRESVETVSPCSNGSPVPQFTLSRVTFTSPDGSETELRDSNTDGAPFRVPNYCNASSLTWDAGRGSQFVSRDGSGLVFTSDSTVLDHYTVPDFSPLFLVSGYLHFPDGTTYRVDKSQISWIRDRNGNKITFTYDPAKNQVTQIVDQNGRITTVTYGSLSCAGSPARYCDLISYAGWLGPETIEVGGDDTDSLLRSGYSPQPLATLFPETQPGVSGNFNWETTRTSVLLTVT